MSFLHFPPDSIQFGFGIKDLLTMQYNVLTVFCDEEKKQVIRRKLDNCLRSDSHRSQICSCRHYHEGDPERIPGDFPEYDE